MTRYENFREWFYLRLLQIITIRENALAGKPAWLIGILHAIAFSKWTDFWWYWNILQMPADITVTSDNPLVNYINVIICRMRNHPEGVYWYNPYRAEPDMHCKGCYDELG